MGTVNVNRNVTDIFYRYKMPRLQAKVEGKGNGIKTVIVNMAEVARAIGRPPTYPTKYFGCELGAQTQFDKNERYIVNGSHDALKLQDLLDGFIRKYVLCPECDNPETVLSVSNKNQTISQSCKACGFHGLLKVNHKVNTFILKNPPTVNPTSQGSSLTEGKRSKRGQKKNGENGDANNSSCANNSGGESDSANQASQTEAEISAAIPAKKGDDDEDDDGWSVDVSKEAIRARLQDLTDGAKGMTISDDYDKTEKERIDIFYELVKKKRDAGQLNSAAVHKDLFIEAERLDIVAKASLVLAELLFSENIILDAKKNRILLLRFTHNNPKAQRYLIGGIEQVVALHAGKLLAKVAGILRHFYELDILEEAAILEWSQKVSKKYVSKEIAAQIHENAKPFVQWLKEAETEESEEESEEDSEVEIEYNDRARVEPLKAAVPTANKKKIEDSDEEGDDIDIDEI